MRNQGVFVLLSSSPDAPNIYIGSVTEGHLWRVLYGSVPGGKYSPFALTQLRLIFPRRTYIHVLYYQHGPGRSITRVFLFEGDTLTNRRVIVLTDRLTRACGEESWYLRLTALQRVISHPSFSFIEMNNEKEPC